MEHPWLGNTGLVRSTTQQKIATSYHKHQTHSSAAASIDSEIDQPFTDYRLTWHNVHTCMVVRIIVAPKPIIARNCQATFDMIIIYIISRMNELGGLSMLRISSCNCSLTPYPWASCLNSQHWRLAVTKDVPMSTCSRYCLPKLEHNVRCPVPSRVN